MKRRDAIRTLTMSMLAPFVARADPTKPLQQELREVWDKACVHRWSPHRDVCEKCGMARMQQFGFTVDELKPDGPLVTRAEYEYVEAPVRILDAKLKP